MVGEFLIINVPHEPYGLKIQVGLQGASHCSQKPPKSVMSNVQDVWLCIGGGDQICLRYMRTIYACNLVHDRDEICL